MSNKVISNTFLVRFNAETGQLVTEMAKAERSVSQKIGGMGKSMQRVSKTLSRTVALPIVGFLGASAKMAMEFDTTMLRMVTLAGKTSEEVAAMRPEIIKTATQYGKSAQEAAEAMYFIASSGVDGSKGMEILQKSLLMSAAGMGETQVLADMLTSAMNAYGSKTLSAAEATDYLIGAIREGKADPAELAGAMSRVLPIASNMGVQFGEVAAAFAALSTGGTDASEAATQLRGILSSILKPSAKAEKTLKGMGLSSEGLRKELKERGLLSLLGLLRERFKGNSSEIASVFGNVRALTGLLDLTGVKWKKSVDIFKGVAGAGGASGEIEELLQGSKGFQYNKSITGLKNSMIEFGDATAPALDKVTESLTGMTDAFNGLSSGQKGIVVKVGLITAAFIVLLGVLGKIAVAFERIAAFAAKYPKFAKAFGLGAATVGVTELSEGLNGNTSWYSRLFGLGELLTGANPQGGLQKLLGKKGTPSAGDLSSMRYDLMRRTRNTRAIGGTVSAGSSFLVGESGPELFTPSSNGVITANNRLGGGSQAVNVTVNVHGSVIRERDLAVSVRDQIAQLMRRQGLNPSILGV